MPASIRASLRRPLANLQALSVRCPRLRDAIGTRCDEAQATALGALVFNRSR